MIFSARLDIFCPQDFPRFRELGSPPLTEPMPLAQFAKSTACETPYDRNVTESLNSSLRKGRRCSLRVKLAAPLRAVRSFVESVREVRGIILLPPPTYAYTSVCNQFRQE